MEEKQYIILRGTLVSGKKEGQYFLSKDKYKMQFIEKMDIDPFPGTLNVRLKEEYLSDFNDLIESEGIFIKGFETEEGSYGDVIAYPSKIEGLKAALVIPRESDYTEVAEIVSDVELRKELALQDGDEVQITVELR